MLKSVATEPAQAGAPGAVSLTRRGLHVNITIHSRVIGSEHTQTVNARELHAFLDVGKVFAAWISERIEKYGFAEDVDYVVTVSKTGIRSNVLQKDYHLSLDMAKELAMVERNDKGREARRYFIECERRLKAQAPTPSPALATPLTADLAAIEMLARFLNVSESGKANMAKVAIEHHSPHLLPALPSYVIDAPIVAGAQGESSLPTKSLTALLKDYGIAAHSRQVERYNQLLEEHGLLRRMSRQSSKDPSITKRFWAITESGLEYGKNVTSPSNPLETQPHWYVDTFGDLMSLLGIYNS